MNVSDFNFDLPKELIAQTPLDDRASSRMLRLDRDSGAVGHSHFYELPNLLKKGDCLVLNDTRVIPARLFGRKPSGAVAEILLLSRKDMKRWEALVKPGRRLNCGDEIIFSENLLRGRIIEKLENGNRIIEFMYDGSFENILDTLGEMPLPPYITEKLSDSSRYQTVYSKNDGSAAAPTAGLHFTPEIIEKLKEKGVGIAYLTLHVGLGTFRPVKVKRIEEHVMHSEYYSIDDKNCRVINDTVNSGGRVIAVGTTSCRTLESAADENGVLLPSSGYTDIFIYPGYRFKITQGLLTNFHLPESTLIMLVSALATKQAVLAAYEEAVRQKYRFFSFGDCMLVL